MKQKKYSNSGRQELTVQARKAPYGATHFTDSFWFSADPVSKKLYIITKGIDKPWRLVSGHGWTYIDMFEFGLGIHIISAMVRGGKRA